MKKAQLNYINFSILALALFIGLQSIYEIVSSAYRIQESEYAENIFNKLHDLEVGQICFSNNIDKNGILGLKHSETNTVEVKEISNSKFLTKFNQVSFLARVKIATFDIKDHTGTIFYTKDLFIFNRNLLI